MLFPSRWLAFSPEHSISRFSPPLLLLLLSNLFHVVHPLRFPSSQFFVLLVYLSPLSFSVDCHFTFLPPLYLPPLSLFTLLSISLGPSSFMSSNIPSHPFLLFFVSFPQDISFCGCYFPSSPLSFVLSFPLSFILHPLNQSLSLSYHVFPPSSSLSLSPPICRSLRPCLSSSPPTPPSSSSSPLNLSPILSPSKSKHLSISIKSIQKRPHTNKTWVKEKEKHVSSLHIHTPSRNAFIISNSNASLRHLFILSSSKSLMPE